MNNTAAISKGQIIRIHTAKSKLNISEDDYRALLSGFNKHSSKELTFDEAEKVLSTFAKLGFKPAPAKRNFIKINVPEDRPEEFASLTQLRMLAAMWVDFSREKDIKSFQHFLKRQLGIDMIQSLLKEDVQKIKKAIQTIGKK